MDEDIFLKFLTLVLFIFNVFICLLCLHGVSGDLWALFLPCYSVVCEIFF